MSHNLKLQICKEIIKIVIVKINLRLHNFNKINIIFQIIIKLIKMNIKLIKTNTSKVY
jgi:hypothetical protein